MLGETLRQPEFAAEDRTVRNISGITVQKRKFFH